MATVQLTKSTEPRFVVHDVSWEEYLTFLDWMAERHVRIAFDGESLELMTTSFEHERWASLTGRLVERLSESLDLDICSGGTVTLKSELVKRGLEADRCYWLANEPYVRHKRKLDLAVDPPPDLAIEVEVSRSILDRLAIYADLGIPEIWRFRDDQLQVLLLGPDGRYHPSESSQSLPMVSIPEMNRWIVRGLEVGERQLIREFVAWINETILPNHPGDRGEPEA